MTAATTATPYLILELARQSTGHDGDVNTWVECQVVQAVGAKMAVRAYVKASKPDGGVFMAIPQRSAKAIRVEVETVTKVSVTAGEV
jgi:hypothetical protein